MNKKLQKIIALVLVLALLITAIIVPALMLNNNNNASVENPRFSSGGIKAQKLEDDSPDSSDSNIHKQDSSSNSDSSDIDEDSSKANEENDSNNSNDTNPSDDSLNSDSTNDSDTKPNSNDYSSNTDANSNSNEEKDNSSSNDSSSNDIDSSNNNNSSNSDSSTNSNSKEDENESTTPPKVSVVASPPTPPTVTEPSKVTYSSLEWETRVLELVNFERAKVDGLAPLTYSTEVAKLADIRAKEISYHWGHSRPNGASFSTVFKENGFSFRNAGENIAAGQISAEKVVADWMNSEGHKANILNPNFTQLGVGHYYDSSSQYKNHWAQLFYTPQ